MKKSSKTIHDKVDTGKAVDKSTSPTSATHQRKSANQQASNTVTDTGKSDSQTSALKSISKVAPKAATRRSTQRSQPTGKTNSRKPDQSSQSTSKATPLASTPEPSSQPGSETTPDNAQAKKQERAQAQRKSIQASLEVATTENDAVCDETPAATLSYDSSTLSKEESGLADNTPRQAESRRAELETVEDRNTANATQQWLEPSPELPEIEEDRRKIDDTEQWLEPSPELPEIEQERGETDDTREWIESSPEPLASEPASYVPPPLENKYLNKELLRDRLLLRKVFKPIIAYVGRLDFQKGVHLIRHGLVYALERGAQFILLGVSPDPGTNDQFWHLKRHLNDNPDCHLEIGFDEELSHLIYAGSDMIIMPSLYEPCGLAQMIALKYGTVPIVRSIGGLADTVFDRDYSSKPWHERNGYVFHQADAKGLESAMCRAIGLWYDYPHEFRQLMINGMKYDYSWNHPGQHYLNIYEYIRCK